MRPDIPPWDGCEGKMSHDARAVLLCLAALMADGCGTANREPDALRLWRSAERAQPVVCASFTAVQQQRSRYEAVTRLAHDNDLRARAFLRLAELDKFAGAYESAAENLRNALLAGPSPQTQQMALLKLGDLLERQLRDTDRAAAAYRQLMAEHPGTPAAELARARLGGLGDAE